MDRPQKKPSVSHKLQKVISFYKNSSPKYLNFLYIIVFCIPIFLITFQNCKTTDVDTSSPQDSSTPAEDINSKIGSIIRIDPVSGDFIADGLLPVDSNVTFKFIKADPASDNYKWTIKRDFNSIVTNAATETDTYKTQFSQLGAYDVSADSYKSTDVKTKARKRVVVGESCSLNDILEIELSSESADSFKVRESGYATFVLKDSANFSSIEWKATLPSGDTTENEEDEDTLTVDLSSESAGTLLIEVSAVSSDTSKAGCLTYRRKELTVTPGVRPYFNPISFTDGRNDIPLQLENNDIYKYARPETNRYLQIEVLNADSCQYQINNGNKVTFSCSDDLIEISSSTDIGCTAGVVTLLASNSQEDHLQSYYHHCPEESSYCYFGATNAKPDHHVCSVDLASASDESNPVSGSCGTVQNTCQIGQLNDIADTSTHYKWQCVGSGGGATVDCETEIPTTTTTSTTTITATTPSCPSDQYTSSSACNSANPSNSTCGAQGNGCYGWSCNSGYRKSGNSCVVCTTSSLCNSSKPANSTCSADNNGCYGWFCDSGYTKSSNSCVPSSSRVNGQCNNSQRNGCSAGTANDSAIADTNTHYRWHCVGSNGGSTATNCQKAKPAPVNGVCKNSQRNGCSAGTANDAVIADTNTLYRWQCVGRNGGTTAANCQKAKPASVNGVCKNSQRNGCTTGTANDAAIADTTTLYKWHCVGANGGSTAKDCQKAIPVNGVCNNSQRNNCSAGTANDAVIADTTTHYRWQCVGRNGGTTAANCQKAKPASINGVCKNSQRNSCSAGTANDSAIADTNTHYRWHCVGSNGGSTATNCQKAKPAPVNGVCKNSQRNGCSAGTANDAVIADTNTLYRWQCVGRNGGTTAANCQKAKPASVNGVCKNSQRNSCSTGTANDAVIADTTTLYKWHCVGANGGTTARNCQKAKPAPVNGVCNNSQRNSCSAGTVAAIADTNTHYTWHCIGANGGTTATNCQKTKPASINGVCNNSQRNSCSTGTANDAVIADTNTHYTWHCVGTNGGATAICTKAIAPINGVCNNTIKNGCTSGTFQEDQLNLDTDEYIWHCVGSGGGTNGTCSTSILLNGVCNNTVKNGCTSGTFQDTPDSETHHRWYCVGSRGGTTHTCSKSK